MLKRPSDQRLTLEERVAVVVAIAVSLAVHAAVFFGGSGVAHLAQEEKKRERLMVIRRVREVTPAPDLAVRVPDPRRVQVPQDPAPEGKAGGGPPKPEPTTSERGTQPPPKAEITPKMEEDLQQSLQKEPQEPAQTAASKAAQTGGEPGDSSVSVVTDLQSASFTLDGPVEYRGTGTFWIRRGAPGGTYRIAFSPVAGFGTPPPQTKELQEKGKIVFVGKYRRGTEVDVESNESGAQFTIYRPDGRPLDMSRPGHATFDDLPPGTYTAVFKDLPGHITPAPQSRTLGAGGSLVFAAEYRAAEGRRAGGDPGGDGRGVHRGGVPGGRGGEGEGTGTGKSGKGTGGGGGAPAEPGLDRRVQLIVTSNPKTSIEDDYTPIRYPDIVISKSNFQQGWCQVYLVVRVDSRGQVGSVDVVRPSAENRAPYMALIREVEQAVRAWDYDKVAAEVHVDARFHVE